MKYVRRDLKLNKKTNRKYAKNYQHNMNIITFLKSNYKYKRRCTLDSSGNMLQQQQHQYNLQQQIQKHKLPVTKEIYNRITKRISFFKRKLSKFLRIFILIMQQATTSTISNCNNSRRLLAQLVVTLATRTRKKGKTNVSNNLVNDMDDDDNIGKNYRQAYKDANEDTDTNVDSDNISDEISHQQHNYDKVSTITSTLLRCQRQRHHRPHQKKASSLLSPSSSSLATATVPSITTTAVVQTNYEIWRWSAILRHYFYDILPNHHLHHHHHHHRHQHHAIHNKSTTSSRILSKCGSSSSSIIRSSAASASICQSVDQYVNATWNRSYTLSCLLLTLFIAFTIGVRSTTAGACWQTVLDNGKCNKIFSLNISKSECCGANQEFAYADREPTNVEHFFATTLGGGMECSPCLESCKNVKCAANKKCVKRKGRPKCICAPECGAARRKRKQREHLMLQQQQQQQQQHHKLFMDVSDAKVVAVGGDIAADAAISTTTNAFKIKLEKSQQSRDTRSLSSEITNINLGLENDKDVIMANSGGTTSLMMERHHHNHHHRKEHNQNQRKLIHIQIPKHKQANNNMQQYTHQQQQQQLQQQQLQQQQLPNDKNQEPKGNRRLLITANVEPTEKPTSRRLQIFSNVRTTYARRHNKNSNNHGHHEDTDPSDYDEEEEDDYDDADDDDDDKDEEAKYNNRNDDDDDDATRFSNQSLSRHKLKTNTKPNNNNDSSNKKKNKNNHDLQKTKVQQHSSGSNNTRVRHHPHQNGRHAENTPYHRHQHNHHQQQQQQQQQHHQQQLHRQHFNHHQQQQQNHGSRRKHKKQHHKHQKNNKDYNTTTATGIGIVGTLKNSSNTGATASAIVTAESSTIRKTTVLNLSSASASTTTSTTIPETQTQPQLLLSSSTTPVNSTMSAADNSSVAAVADHHHHQHYHSKHFKNHGSKIATSSSLSSPSLSATSARLPSDSTFGTTTTTLSAKGEGVSFYRHHQDRNEITTMISTSTTNSNNNNVNSISTLNLYSHNKQQLQQQTQQQLQQHNTPLFDGILDQFDLHGFPNKQHTITNTDNIRPRNPVCGTDGRTYNTECQLRKRACRTDNPNLQLAYRGHCKTTCNGVKCLNGLTCVEDQYLMPHCIPCKIECPRDDYDNDVGVDATKAVCGADGKTYKSTCDINRMICRIGRSIGVAYPGPCREDQVTCDDINCGPKQICLIDLLTHKPRCTTCRYKCSRKRRPSSLRFEEGKICGVNNRTYNSWCEMRKDSCSTGFYIDVKYSGDCH